MKTKEFEKDEYRACIEKVVARHEIPKGLTLSDEFVLIDRLESEIEREIDKGLNPAQHWLGD